MGTPAKKHKVGIFFIFLAAAVLLRLVFLDLSARFTQDESSDLTRMHDYFASRKITLVGPISNDKVKVFGSLTYYMLMPFAIIGKFDPISPVYGTVFWGTITAVVLFFLIKKINPHLTIVGSLLIAVWYPLLESSRWAWNPHLVPFWVSLGLWLFLSKNKWTPLISGLCFGLSVHNHYIALIPTTIFLLSQLPELIQKQKWQKIFFVFAGYGFGLLPFLLFDLRHPPGLFMTSYIGARAPHLQQIDSIARLLEHLGRNIYVAGFTMVRQQWTSILLLGLTGLLISFDVVGKKFKHLVWLLPPVGLLCLGIFLDGFETRYFLSAFIFYFVFLILPRRQFAQRVQYSVMFMLVSTSILMLPSQLFTSPVQPNIKIVRGVSQEILNLLKENPEIKNANITTDMSSDLDMLSYKYRDLLSISGVSFRAASEYDVSEHLFVITQGNEAELRKSISYPLMVLQKGLVRDVREIPNSNWKVFWFSY